MTLQDRLRLLAMERTSGQTLRIRRRSPLWLRILAGVLAVGALYGLLAVTP